MSDHVTYHHAKLKDDRNEGTIPDQSPASVLLLPFWAQHLHIEQANLP